MESESENESHQGSEESFESGGSEETGNSYEEESEEEEDKIERLRHGDPDLRTVFINYNDESDDALARTDEFVEALEGNTVITKLQISVYSISLYSPDRDGEGEGGPRTEEHYERWEKLCRAFGKLENLSVLTIEGAGPGMDSRGLLLTLRNIKQVTQLDLQAVVFQTAWEPDYVEPIMASIRGLISLEKLSCASWVGAVDMNLLFAAFSTLPNLRELQLSSYGHPHQGIRAQPIGQVLRVSSLRELAFSGYQFDEACIREFSAAMDGGCAITKLELHHCGIDDDDGSFCDAVMKKSRIEKLTISGIPSFYRPLGRALSVSNTLKDLVLWLPEGADGGLLAPVFIGLETNQSLRSLSIHGRYTEMDDHAFGALRTGLGKNLSLQELSLDIQISDERWLGLVPYVRDSKSLKSLVFRNELSPNTVVQTVEAFATNSSLETVEFTDSDSRVSSQTFAACIKKLDANGTLKKLKIPLLFHEKNDRDAAALVFEALKQNYSLEEIEEWSLGRMPPKQKRMIEVALRLNASGRRYLIEDPASRSKGIEVLCHVSDDIDCLFFHLLENPLLCDLHETYISSSDGRGTKRTADSISH